MFSLTEFITNELKNFHLRVNKKNLTKLRNKYTKELKARNLWNNAKTELIGKSKTKIFKKEDLENISRSFYDYMKNLVIEESGFSKKEILDTEKKITKEIEDSRTKWINFLETHTQDEIYEYEHQYNYVPDPPANEQQKREGLNELMLTALFNKFFTMTDEQKEMFFNDLSTKYWNGEEMATSPNWIIGHKRLEHPEKYYYSEKSN